MKMAAPRFRLLWLALLRGVGGDGLSMEEMATIAAPASPCLRITAPAPDAVVVAAPPSMRGDAAVALELAVPGGGAALDLDAAHVCFELRSGADGATASDACATLRDLDCEAARDGDVLRCPCARARLSNLLPGRHRLDVVAYVPGARRCAAAVAVDVLVAGDAGRAKPAVNVRLALAGPNVTTADTWAAAGAGAPTASRARAAYFDGVYDLRYWSWGGAADTDSDSGRGSSAAATAGARSWLRAVVDGYGARSVLDVACGDARWVSRVDLPVEYLGVDVSAAAVARARENAPTRAFAVLDAVADALPPASDGAPFDLVLNRHMAYHLPAADNVAALRRFAGSGARFLLLTTHVRADENDRTFVLADGHAVNLFRRPYCLKAPLALFPDGAPDVYLGLWALGGAPLDGGACDADLADLAPLIVDDAPKNLGQLFPAGKL